MFQGPGFLFAFLSVGAVALFGFLAVASWAGARQQERESYYKNDMLKKVAESNTPSATATIEYLQEQERATVARREAKKREGYSMSGLINIGIGLALMIFLTAISHKPAVGLAGLFPLLTGIALLLHTYLLSRRKAE
ncbi:MAG TPA: hypothetical protein VHB45_16115 [Alloacidobacterium sp.]|nr:hypothetical protein [Alloacidobacterium sp.]